MRDEDLQRLEKIYENLQTDVTVYKGLYLPEQVPVVIKDLQFSSVTDAAQAVDEALCQARLSGHPHVVKLYGVCLTEQSAGCVVSLALEAMDTDLFEETVRRQSRGWTEEELWACLGQMVDVLSTAQRLGVCHRDIKPHNIFLKGACFKLGDFGASRLRNPADHYSLQGSPYFLAPVLKRSLTAHLSNPQPHRVLHNVYKSDVYSLALSLLFLAKLKQSEPLCELNNLERATLQETESLAYSANFVELLRHMLRPEEKDRPDFLELWQGLQPLCQDLLSALNQTPSEEALRTVFASQQPLQVSVGLTLTCYHCAGVYQLDITAGCPEASTLYFCSQACFADYAAQPVERMESQQSLRKSLDKSLRLARAQRVCLRCGGSVAEGRLACTKCMKQAHTQLKQELSEHCVVCTELVVKPKGLRRLFMKRKRQVLECGHIVCSRECLEVLKHSSLNCLFCGKRVIVSCPERRRIDVKEPA